MPNQLSYDTDMLFSAHFTKLQNKGDVWPSNVGFHYLRDALGHEATELHRRCICTDKQAIEILNSRGALLP